MEVNMTKREAKMAKTTNVPIKGLRNVFSFAMGG
jgi:hypothetical protein